MDKEETVTFDEYQLVRPCIGETVSGDITVTKPTDTGLLAAIVDVSGHGVEAHELAECLKNEIMNWSDHHLAQVMHRLNEVLNTSRGAAVGLAFFDGERSSLDYIGVGNTCIRKYGKGTWRGVSRDGVLGSRMPTLREATVQLSEGDVIALYTDGLKERISLEDDPRLTLDTPSAIASNLIARFGKHYDDASCIVIKCRA